VKPQALLNDQMSDKKYAGMLRKWFGAAALHLKPGAPVYIAHADSKRCLNEAAAIEAGFYIAQTIIWVKQAFTLGRQDYQWQHEPILYGWKPGAAHYWQGGFCQATVIDEEQQLAKLSKAQLVALVNELRNARESTVVREPRQNSDGLHPTIKPLRLVARQVWNSSRRGDTVLELFGGSGTTLAAAEQTGRVCAATELDPKYCAVILERMSAYGLSIEKVHELG
jgi:DNA modification methylase